MPVAPNTITQQATGRTSPPATRSIPASTGNVFPAWRGVRGRCGMDARGDRRSWSSRIHTGWMSGSSVSSTNRR
jgi:hypothetical protein